MHYYGRSMQVDTRATQHSRDLNNKDPTKPLWKHCMDYPGHTFSPLEATKLLYSTRDLNLCKMIEAACINTFHSCNRAWPDVSLSDTFSSFVTHITGIKGRSKRLTAIEPRTAPSTSTANTPQNTVVDTPLAISDASPPQSQINGPMIGSSVIHHALGSTHIPPTGTNDSTLLDHSSLSYTMQGSQNNILDMMLTGPMDESHISSSSPSTMNLAFLNETNGHLVPVLKEP